MSLKDKDAGVTGQAGAPDGAGRMTQVMDAKQIRYGRWSLSEFLNLVELRSQTWCCVKLGRSGGFRIPHNEAILFYAVLKGTARIVGATAEAHDLCAGDILMVLSGKAHALRIEREGAADVLEFLHNGEYVDVPHSIVLGHGPPMTRLLCGRLKVRWPGGHRPPALPPTLNLNAGESIIDLDALEEVCKQTGGAAMLTRAASLLFTVAFRAHPQSELIFRDLTLHDPIARARQLIQTHPFIDWSVGLLARKVGLSRSNFAARFVEEVGRTPIDFVTEERMVLAANFLANSNMKIAEISERTGYRSEAAFSRRFTTYFGMSPGRMRRAWRRSQHQTAGSAASPTLQ